VIRLGMMLWRAESVAGGLAREGVGGDRKATMAERDLVHQTQVMVEPEAGLSEVVRAGRSETAAKNVRQPVRAVRCILRA